MWFNHARKTYNLALEAVRKKQFGCTEFDRLRWRFVVKQQLGNKLSYLNDTPSKIRANAIRDLCDSFETNFLKRKINPHHKFEVQFRSRREEQSIVIEPDSFVTAKSKEKYKIFLPKSIRHQIFTKPDKPSEFWSTIDSACRLIMNRLGQVYICVPIRYDKISPPLLQNIVALDPGIRTFQTAFSPENLNAFVEFGKSDIERITRLCLHLDKLLSSYDSSESYQRRRRLKKAINRLRLRIFRLKKDCHHRCCDYLTKNYDVILLPRFEVSQMIIRKKRKLRKKSVRELLNWSHFMFQQSLLKKAEERGKKVIIVTEEYTSKTCCNCGWIHQKLKGSKVFKCKECGVTIDRDFNGAVNILIKYLTELESVSVSAEAIPPMGS